MNNVLQFSPTAPRLSDADARERALDIRASCIVEAPAGSGKTGLLVQRFLKLLADESVGSPEEVLAVTFTRKATAELRDRVLKELLLANKNEPLTADTAPFVRSSREFASAALQRSRQLNWRLLEQPMRLNIQTFDAVGMQIANALPLLSGSGGPREPLEDARSLYNLAARRTLLELGGSNPSLHQALRTVLLHRDGNLNDTGSLIAGMLEKREQWGSLVPLSVPLDDTELDTVVRKRLERALETIVNAGLQRALDAFPPDGLEYLTHFAHRHAQEPGYNGAPNPIAHCTDKRLPPEPTADCINHWLALIRLVLKESDGDWRKSLAINSLGFKPAKKDSDALKEFIAEVQSEPLRSALHAVLRLPPTRYPDEQWHVAKALFHVLRHALAELKLLFANRGECDFSELALAAREVLRSDHSASDLALSAGGNLRHLLIDEMQDTSAGQYDLIELLTQSWDGHAQTLFLVGDPKQSIYLFRAASVERFLRTMTEQRLGDIPLKALRLTANFRSQAALIEGENGFNEAFTHLFLTPNAVMTEALDVPFVAATVSRQKTQPEGVVWHAKVLEPEDVDYAQQEAQTIRSIIEHRLAKPLPVGRTKPWRIAVLGHGRRHLDAVVDEFKIDRGNGPLAFKAINLDSLEDRPEVLDALALTRALLHPADRIAWLAVLHAPWCGLDRADLLVLTGDGTGRDVPLSRLIANHRELLSAEGQRLLARTWPVLETAIATLGRTPLATQVERTWRSLGGDAGLSAEQQSNVQQYLAALRDLDTDGGRIDLEVLTSRLSTLYAEPFAGTAHVELLTIHKAKGLEWDLVLVPGLERGSGQSRHPLLNWLEFATNATDEASVILAPISSKGTPASKLSEWLTGLRGRREVAERKRLFYVATTRAQEELHLFAAVKPTTSGISHGAPSSLLKACWEAAVRPLAAIIGAPVISLAQPDAGELGPHLLDEHEEDTLALAAEGTPVKPQFIRRLPLSFDPARRFVEAAANRLPYVAVATLPKDRPFERPEGSFGVRAFGNVIHRYLQLMSDCLLTSEAATLAAELPVWQPRLEASLRGEGVPPRDAAREASRALEALTRTLADPTGLWLLSPHAEAASESDLTALGPVPATLRVDRTFVAGQQPLDPGESTIWIIDFKTTEQGSLPDTTFDSMQQSRYSAQLEAYAKIRRSLPNGQLPIHLGLYFPLGSRLIHWPAVGNTDT